MYVYHLFHSRHARHRLWYWDEKTSCYWKRSVKDNKLYPVYFFFLFLTWLTDDRYGSILCILAISDVNIMTIGPLVHWSPRYRTPTLTASYRDLCSSPLDSCSRRFSANVAYSFSLHQRAAQVYPIVGQTPIKTKRIIKRTGKKENVLFKDRINLSDYAHLVNREADRIDKADLHHRQLVLFLSIHNIL